MQQYKKVAFVAAVLACLAAHSIDGAELIRSKRQIGQLLSGASGSLGSSSGGFSGLFSTALQGVGLSQTDLPIISQIFGGSPSNAASSILSLVSGGSPVDSAQTLFRQALDSIDSVVERGEVSGLPVGAIRSIITQSGSPVDAFVTLVTQSINGQNGLSLDVLRSILSAARRGGNPLSPVNILFLQLLSGLAGNTRALSFIQSLLTLGGQNGGTISGIFSALPGSIVS